MEQNELVEIMKKRAMLAKEEAEAVLETASVPKMTEAKLNQALRNARQRVHAVLPDQWSLRE